VPSHVPNGLGPPALLRMRRGRGLTELEPRPARTLTSGDEFTMNLRKSGAYVYLPGAVLRRAPGRQC
jgi:hypothetical protein